LLVDGRIRPGSVTNNYDTDPGHCIKQIHGSEFSWHYPCCVQGRAWPTSRTPPAAWRWWSGEEGGHSPPTTSSTQYQTFTRGAQEEVSKNNTQYLNYLNFRLWQHNVYLFMNCYGFWCRSRSVTLSTECKLSFFQKNFNMKLTRKIKQYRLALLRIKS
jgi:hypothetical protein